MKSPNYPAMSLPEAIDAISKVWKKHEREAVTMEEISGCMEYSSLSGPSRSKISALKKYGLIEKEGGGWKLTTRAMSILHKPQGSPERQEALNSAVRDVRLFSELIRTHGQASKGALRAHLLTDKAFTSVGAKAFIKSFLDTKSLVSGSGGGKISEFSVDKPSVGDLVQWELQGAVQFPEPRRLAGISDDGLWAFVEGSQTGVPFAELTIAEKGTGAQMTTGTMMPPANPFFQEPSAGSMQDVYGLSEGDVVLRWPEKLSKASFEEVSDWLDLIKRKLERSIVEPTDE